MATQLTHLPRFASYNAGNMLSYSPHDSSFDARLREELTASKILLDFLRQTRMLPFRLRLNAVAIAQRDVLHDPSIYVITVIRLFEDASLIEDAPNLQP